MTSRKQKVRAGDAPLLAYAIGTTPDPILVSTTTVAATATITVSVTPAGSAAVYCDKITLFVMIGDDGQALSSSTPTAAVNTAKWNIASVEIKTAAELGLGDGADQYATFIFECTSPADYKIGGYALVFTLTAAPNTIPGIILLNVEESSGPTVDPKTFGLRDAGFPLTKAPSVFYLQNFIANAVSATAAPAKPATKQAIPVTGFANGVLNGIVLSWDGNGGTYTLYAAGNQEPIYSGSLRSYILPVGPSVDTTYVIQATLVSSAQHGRAADTSTYQYLYQALTLTVSDPDLTPKSVATLDVLDNAVIGGTCQIAQTVTAYGGMKVTQGLGTDTLDATGSTTLADASTSGLLTASAGAEVKGGLTSDDLTVTNNLVTQNMSVHGALALPGSSHMINGATTLSFSTSAATWYTANTDGFLIGSVLWDSSGANPHNTTRVALYSGVLGAWVYATGGNYCAQIYGDPSWWMAGMTGVASVPVQAGSTFGVLQTNDPNNDDNSAACSFWFVPLGAVHPCSSFVKKTNAPPNMPPSHSNPAVRAQRPGLDVLSALQGSLQGSDAGEFKTAFAKLLRTVLS